LQGIARRAAELLGDACVISLLSPDERTLRAVAIYDVDAQRLDALRASAPERPLSSPDSLRVKVINSGRALRIDDLSAQSALPAQTSLYESFLKAQSDMGDGVSITEGTHFVYANEALARIYGYSLAELLSLGSFLDLVTPEERASVQERLRQRQQGETSSNN